ncbi:hypothetical protein [Leeuwenhoekiella sp. LLG6367-2.1]|uniref:hypothetical protein n=1 Tax=Leeuwenhoekiella sp. LLG6367-2.1 TaxID=3160833 RepID=UPI00386DB618
MKYLGVCLLLVLLTSCRGKMDSCIDNLVEDGMSRSEARELCEEGRDNSYRR